MITYINRAKIEPHPDNPRRELGDLSELTASIRRQGILQNLTVVPIPADELARRECGSTTSKGGQPQSGYRTGVAATAEPGQPTYRLVIGHRRFAASALAGIDELPCVIDYKMSHAEQIAVMMSENMQRNDLTIAERVGGVQMMMDLGMDAGAVADATGISQTSVRRYSRLSALPKSGIAKAERQGATLMQLIDISQIGDDELRSKALETAGTNEYNAVIYRWRAEQAKCDRLPPMRDKLNAFAVEIKNPQGWTWMANYHYSEADVIKEIGAFKPEPDGKYGYLVGPYVVSLYERRQRRDGAAAAAESQRKKEARERLDARKALERELAEGFNGMRDQWITDDFAARGHEDACMRFVLWVLARPEYLGRAEVGGRFDYCMLPERVNGMRTNSLKLAPNEIDAIPGKDMLTALVLIAYDRISEGYLSLMDSAGHYAGGSSAERALELYDRLEAMGYPVSAEERAWLDGTHACYRED